MGKNSYADKTVVERIAGVPLAEQSKLIDAVKAGLPYRALLNLQSILQVSCSEIGEALLIAPSTMSRRKVRGYLRPEESDRVVRLARVLDLATSMMDGDEMSAATWMRTPRSIFNGESPLMRSETEIGVRDVEDLIGRIRSGVFS
jgi:putative toxin-antitoxin system antitoxin component (TIGR02293 family)